MVSRTGRAIPLALGLLAVLTIGSSASGQGNSFNPYGNSGYADYREFSTPMYGNNPSLPGQARLQGEGIGGATRGGRVTQYEAYTRAQENGSDGDSAAGRKSYKSNNTEADRAFKERMKRREALYDQALAEKDPVKRARLMKEAEKSAIDQPSKPTKPGTARANPGATGTARPGSAPNASSTARSNPAPAPPGSSRATDANRRTTAPSPFGRSGTSGATPAPDPFKGPGRATTTTRPRTNPPATTPAPAASGTKPTGTAPATTPAPAPAPPNPGTTPAPVPPAATGTNPSAVPIPPPG